MGLLLQVDAVSQSALGKLKMSVLVSLVSFWGPRLVSLLEEVMKVTTRLYQTLGPGGKLTFVSIKQKHIRASPHTSLSAPSLPSPLSFFHSIEGLGIFCAHKYFINSILFNALADNTSCK